MTPTLTRPLGATLPFLPRAQLEIMVGKPAITPSLAELFKKERRESFMAISPFNFN
jgi:hypothetical protein